jgi:hypothetical protein
MEPSEISLWQEAVILVRDDAYPKNRALWLFCSLWYWNLLPGVGSK